MQADLNALNKRVIARNSQGSKYAEGVVVGACDAPTLAIKVADGTIVWWRADLCEEAPAPARQAELPVDEP